MKRTILAVALTLATASATAADWIPIAELSNATFFGRAGSAERNTTTSGRPIVQMTIRVHDKQADNFEFGIVYVSLEDCAAQQGRLVYTNLNGSAPSGYNFVFGGGNGNSIIAETLCDTLRPSAARSTRGNI